jgi:hypothetical protein
VKVDVKKTKVIVIGTCHKDITITFNNDKSEVVTSYKTTCALNLIVVIIGILVWRNTSQGARRSFILCTVSVEKSTTEFKIEEYVIQIINENNNFVWSSYLGFESL